MFIWVESIKTNGRYDLHKSLKRNKNVKAWAGADRVYDDRPKAAMTESWLLFIYFFRFFRALERIFLPLLESLRRSKYSDSFWFAQEEGAIASDVSEASRPWLRAISEALSGERNSDVTSAARHQ